MSDSSSAAPMLGDAYVGPLAGEDSARVGSVPGHPATSHRFTDRLKATTVRLMTETGAANLCRPLTRNAAVVFMLHRFSDRERGVSGQDPLSVRHLLGYLRREKYQLVDIATLFASLRGEGPPLRHAVGFTIDDGYLDHATIAGPAFAEFDCPVTTFVTSGFLDGDIWFWWDRIEYIFQNTIRTSLTVELGTSPVRYVLGTPHDRRVAQGDFTTLCKALGEPAKLDAIRLLAERADIALPRSAPASYAPMSWDQLRACERRGMTFGPHTVTHPILARTSDAQARIEITESWDRLRSEAGSAVPIFAYPNGQPGDFGEREFDLLRAAGLEGAVVGTAGFTTAKSFGRAHGRYLVPRFPFPDQLPYLVQQVSGLERLKFLLRGQD